MDLTLESCPEGPCGVRLVLLGAIKSGPKL
jgi:hypothetical protein